MDEVVMYIVIRGDLGMPKGKIAAQAGHAVQLAIRAVERSDDPEAIRHLQEWEGGSYVKIALRADGEEALRALAGQLTDAGITCPLVTDEGRTAIPAGTLTALATQPLPRSRVAPLVAGLRLL